MHGFFVVQGIHDSEVYCSSQIHQVGPGTILNTFFIFNGFVGS